MTRHPKKTMKLKASTSSTNSSIENIPDELVPEVLCRVAASSLTDMINAKMSCKRLKEISEEKYIYQRVTLDKFPVVPWAPLSDQQKTFLNKCQQHKNPELIYRQAVLDYFNRRNLRSAINNLQEAMNLRHMGAFYVTCIVLILCGDDESKEKGINLLGDMKNSRSTKRLMRSYRKKLIKTLRQMWVKNPNLKEPPICCSNPDQHQWKSKWSEEDEDVTCDACWADREIKFICSTYSYDLFDM